uniref:Secreted protein n=1 Tax=Anguilla anguilla TaxID=7936 RepID=A0A0E9R1Y4_ANGAN
MALAAAVLVTFTCLISHSTPLLLTASLIGQSVAIPTLHPAHSAPTHPLKSCSWFKLITVRTVKNVTLAVSLLEND